jgi:hypothetical protein
MIITISLRRLTSVLVLAAAASSAFVSRVRADELVNTGTPDNSNWANFASYQGAAAEFSLTGTDTITGIDGYFEDQDFSQGNGAPFTYPAAGTIDVSIVEGNSGSPSDTVVYSGSFAISDDQPAAWLGVTGLDTTLGAGQYWVEFTTTDASAAVIGDAPENVHTLLGGDGNWYNSTYGPLEMGLEVYGSPDVQPPPPSVPDTGSTAGLFAIGAAGLLAFGHRRRLSA